MLEIHQRTGWLFVAVVVAHLVLISAQAKTGRGVPVLESVVFGAFAELQRGATAAVSGVQGTWGEYVALQRIRRENESLRGEAATLRVALEQERAAAAEADVLRDLLELKRTFPFKTTGARVIGGAADTSFRTLTIDKGSEDGVTADMAVIAPRGVVGRVVQPTARAAKVQLLIDRTAAAGALVERSRVHATVQGNGTELHLEYVAGTADIRVGDRVVTSGLEGIYPPLLEAPPAGQYPKGYVIGHIESVERAGGRFTSVVVRPAVDYSTLETVLVVLEAQSTPVATAAAGEPDR
jgi:rod shape-determining protein MreC